MYSKQPDWVKAFFKIPLGQIQRFEKELNPIIDPKQQKFGFTTHMGYINQGNNLI